MEHRSEIIDIISSYLDRLCERELVFRWEVDSYRPEFFRYGGALLIGHCESLFYADSILCWNFNGICQDLTPEAAHDLRVSLLAATTIHRAKSLGLTIQSVCTMLTNWKKNYTVVVADPIRLQKSANDIFHRKRNVIKMISENMSPDKLASKSILRHYNLTKSPLASMVDNFSKSATTQSPEAILDSLFHMMANRLFPNWSREEEFLGVCTASRLAQWLHHE